MVLFDGSRFDKIVCVYLNENLIKKKVLTSMVKQNYGDVYMCDHKGFSGYLSNIRYFDRYIPYAYIRNHLNRGPSTIPCVDSHDSPPYFDSTWWTSHN